MAALSTLPLKSEAIFWLDAGRESYTDGQAITQFNDQSGSARHFAAAAGWTYETNQMQSTESAYHVQSNTSATLTYEQNSFPNGMTFAMVVQNNLAGGGPVARWGSNNKVFFYFAFTNSPHAGGTCKVYIGDTTETDSNTGLLVWTINHPVTESKIYALRYKGAGVWNLRVDGVDQGDTTLSSPPSWQTDADVVSFAEGELASASYFDLREAALWMRSLTEIEVRRVETYLGGGPNETKPIASGEYSVHARVWIENGSGAPVDFTTLSGKNWVERVEYGADVDEPVATATVTLRLDHDALSLSPFVTGSKLNASSLAVEVGREIVIQTATVPLGGVPGPYDYRTVFHGEIDEVNFPLTAEAGTITLSCRDLGARLQDRWLEQNGRPDGANPPQWSKSYVAGPPTTNPINVEAVMQEILDDWGPDSPDAVTLVVPTSPAWALTNPDADPKEGYLPGKVSVLQAIQTLAQMIGWVARYRYQETADDFEFRLYEPDRTKTTPDITLAPAEVLSISPLARSRDGVRNVVKVSYYTSTAEDATPTEIVLSDSTSITAFGRRYFEIAEDKYSLIDTSSEATQLCQAALDDLKDVKAEAAVETLYRWDVDLETLIRLSATTRAFDGNLNAAVTGVRHTIAAGRGRTVANVRQSAPIGYYKGWWAWGKMDGRGIDSSNLPAFTLTATPHIQGVTLHVTNAPRPTLMSGIEWHLSTTAGFTPSSSTLRKTTLASKVEIDGLTQGTTYYAKAVLIRATGRKSTASNQVSFTPALVYGTDIADNQVAIKKLDTRGSRKLFIW